MWTSLISIIVGVSGLVAWWMTDRTEELIKRVSKGYAFIKVVTMENRIYYGWVRRNSIIGFDKITYEKMQWFIEIAGIKKYIIRIEDVKTIGIVENNVEAIFHGAYKMRMD